VANEDKILTEVQGLSREVQEVARAVFGETRAGSPGVLKRLEEFEKIQRHINDKLDDLLEEAERRRRAEVRRGESVSAWKVGVGIGLVVALATTVLNTLINVLQTLFGAAP
jgi:hypothetical protein